MDPKDFCFKCGEKLKEDECDLCLKCEDLASDVLTQIRNTNLRVNQNTWKTF